MESTETSTVASEPVSNEAQETLETSAPDPDEQTFDVDGEQVSLKELKRRSKLTKGAYQAFEETAKTRKAFEAERAIFEQQKRDAKALLADPEVGESVRNAIIEELAAEHDRLQMLDKMSPQEQSIYEKEQALAKREAAIQARDAEYKALEEKAAKEAADLQESAQAKQYALQVEKEYTKAFETAGLPIEPLLLMLTQKNHLSSVSNGVEEATVQDMLEVADEEATQLIGGHIDNLSDEKLAAKLGKKRIERIGKLYVDGVKPKVNAGYQKRSQEPEKKPSSQTRSLIRNLIS